MSPEERATLLSAAEILDEYLLVGNLAEMVREVANTEGGVR